MTKPKIKHKIKYASRNSEQDAAEDAHHGGIEYHGSSLLRPGSDGPWRDSPNNPMSPAFVSLDKRGEMGKARFFALRKRHLKRPSHGVYDP